MMRERTEEEKRGWEEFLALKQKHREITNHGHEWDRNYYPESMEHLELKIHASKILQSLGFPKSNIYEEYVVKDGKRKYRVDVVGIIPNQRKIAIECGSTKKENIEALRGFFDVVIHIPYTLTPIFVPKPSTNSVKRRVIKHFNEGAWEIKP